MKMKLKIFFSFIFIILILSIILSGCSTGTKYTYEEYKKIKAMEDNNSDDDKAQIADDEEAYSMQLSDFYAYLEEFRTIYTEHNNKLQPLMDSFDDEIQEIEKKKEYAEQIIDIEQDWISDLNNISVPDFVSSYHEYFQDFLNNERKFYEYFLEEDLDNADDFALRSSESFNNSLIEMEEIKNRFNARASELGVDAPF